METYLRQFDVEKHEMASVMGICAGLVGLKSVNVKKALVFSLLFEGSRRPGGIQEDKQLADNCVSFGIWGDFGDLSEAVRRRKA